MVSLEDKVEELLETVESYNSEYGEIPSTKNAVFEIADRGHPLNQNRLNSYAENIGDKIDKYLDVKTEEDYHLTQKLEHSFYLSTPKLVNIGPSSEGLAKSELCSELVHHRQHYHQSDTWENEIDNIKSQTLDDLYALLDKPLSKRIRTINKMHEGLDRSLRAEIIMDDEELREHGMALKIFTLSRGIKTQLQTDEDSELTSELSEPLPYWDSSVTAGDLRYNLGASELLVEQNYSDVF